MNTNQENKLVADRAQTYLAKRIAEMASRMPELSELTPNQVDAISRAVLIDELKSEMKRAVLAARTDWHAEVAAFLSDKKANIPGTPIDPPCAVSLHGLNERTFPRPI